MKEALVKLTENYTIKDLMVMQAMYKTLAEVISTKDPDSLRSRIDLELIQKFQAEGVDRIRVPELNSYISVRMSKPAVEEVATVTDFNQFRQWLADDENKDTVMAYLNRDLQSVANWLKDQGIVPDGCEVHTHKTEPRILGTLLKVDQQKALEHYAEANNIKGLFKAVE